MNLTLIAKRLEADLRSRDLQAGDKYITVSEAATLLGVSRATAHRAMNLLVRRELLAGEHGRGIFVGQAVGPKRTSARIRTMYVLMPEDQVQVSGVQLETLITAIRSRMPGVGVQFGFVPKEDGLAYVRELIGAAQAMGHFAGAIPISCSRAIYKYLADSAAPVVVLGSVYDDQHALPSVDVDNHRVGYLLTSYLIGRKHRRIALLASGEGRPGDNAFFDGVSQAMTESELPHNALVVRIFPQDFDAFAVQIRSLLAREDRPTAIICGSPRFRSTVESVIADLKLRVPEDLELAFESQATPDADGLPYVHVQPQMPFAKVAEVVADMLNCLSESGQLETRRLSIPVELREPLTAK